MTSPRGAIPSETNQSTELARPSRSRGTSLCIIDSQITLPKIIMGEATIGKLITSQKFVAMPMTRADRVPIVQ